MEAAIISACVAGVISGIGVWISYRLVVTARRTVADHLKFGAALRSAEHSIREIKGFCSEAEQLRNASWKLLTEVTGLQKERQDNFEVLRLQGYESQFGKVCNRFFQTWAIVQAEVPDTAVEALKELRLQCKNEAEEVLNILSGLKELKKRNARGGGVDETLYTLKLRLESLHGNLDRILFTMMMARDTVLVDTWTGSQG